MRKLSLIAKLSKEDEQAILALPHEMQVLKEAQFAVREGDEPTHIFLLLSGFAIRHKTAADGARQILNLHMTGDLVDLQNLLLSVADCSVQALTAINAAFVPREAIIELAFARPAVGKALWLDTLIESSIARESTLNIGRRAAPQRTAHLLCEYAYRLNAIGLGGPCRYFLPMTQNQIADALGLTHVHVNRTLRALDELGLVAWKNRFITIADLPRLVEFAGFRPLYLHLPSHKLPDPEVACPLKSGPF